MGLWEQWVPVSMWFLCLVLYLCVMGVGRTGFFFLADPGFLVGSRPEGFVGFGFWFN